MHVQFRNKQMLIIDNPPAVAWLTVVVATLIAIYVAFNWFMQGQNLKAVALGIVAAIGLVIVPHNKLASRIQFDRNRDRLTYRKRFLWFNPTQRHPVSTLQRVETATHDEDHALLLIFADRDAPVPVPTYTNSQTAETLAAAINDWLSLDSEARPA